MTHRNRLAIGILIFLAAVVPRLLVLAYVGAGQPRRFYLSDSVGYVTIARNLLEHGTFSDSTDDPSSPDLIRTPVYPFVLAAIFRLSGDEPTVVALQIFAGALVALLAFLLALELRFSVTAALLAGLFVSFDVLSILLSNLLMTETLFTGLLIGAVWLLVRYWRGKGPFWLVGSAALFALATLTRPIAQALPLALLPLFALWLRHKPARAIAGAGLAFVAISALLILPWAYRNHRAGGTFSVSRIADRNLLFYRARAVIAKAEGLSQDDALETLKADIERATTEEHLTSGQRYDLMRRTALTVLWQHPAETTAMLVKGGIRFFADPGYAVVCSFLDPTRIAFECLPGRGTMLTDDAVAIAIAKFGDMNRVQQAALVWSVALWAAMYGGCAVGVVTLIRRRDWEALSLLSVIVIYFALLSSGGETNYRFRVPVAPFLAILAGRGYDHLIAAWRRSTAERNNIQNLSG